MNYLSSLDGLFWLLAALVVLVFLQRTLHRQIQAVLLILTRRAGLTQGIFAFIFLPGVFLHESSHFLMAKLLGVRTGKFSLIPKAQSNGRLRLGYVEITSGGFLRDALIGVAPLVTGTLIVAYMAIYRLHLLPLWDVIRLAEWSRFWSGLGEVLKVPGFWFWFYLTFAISSTMMPSASDRHAWLPFGLLAGVLIILAILTGAGPWMLENLAPPFNSFLRGLALIFGLSSSVHLLLILPFLIFHLLLARLTRVDIE
jgi:hypothetical protein